MLECVANVSEGRDRETLASVAAACGDLLLDLHADPDHHRSVFTLAGAGGDLEAAVRGLTETAVALLDLSGHDGHHPRFGVVDVVPFVPLPPASWTDAAGRDVAVAARDRYAAWLGGELSVPVFLYGPMPGGAVRTLPQVRQGAFGRFAPDAGPPAPHPTAGATAAGARGVLVAYNMWVSGGDTALARSVAAAVRAPAVRALAFDLSSGLQVSCNLIDPAEVGPAQVHDEVARLLAAEGAGIDRCELVGLVPAAVLEAVPRHRWRELGLAEETTIEARLEARSLS